MKYVKDYRDFTLISEKLVYDNGVKKHYTKKQTKNDLKRAGYLEVFDVPGIGSFVAKLDSGNGSASSIMCDSFTDNGEYVDWEINGVKMHSKKCGENVVVNRNDEIRILVELDIEFDGVKYEKVPVGLTDRTKNYTKLLINRTFINTCHLMIDTGNSFILTKRPKNFSVNNKSKYSGIYFYKDDEEE